MVRRKCRSVLKSDLRLFRIRRLEAAARRQNVEQREFDALVSLAFNIGLSNLRSSSLLRAYRVGDKMTAHANSWTGTGPEVVCFRV